jgi:hypothetical protein
MKGRNGEGFSLSRFTTLFNDTRALTALWTSRWSLTGSYRAKRLDNSVSEPSLEKAYLG